MHFSSSVIPGGERGGGGEFLKYEIDARHIACDVLFTCDTETIMKRSDRY